MGLFVPSVLTPNRDVPGLGWFRPGSREAKLGVVLILDLLRVAGVSKGARK